MLEKIKQYFKNYEKNHIYDFILDGKTYDLTDENINYLQKKIEEKFN